MFTFSCYATINIEWKRSRFYGALAKGTGGGRFSGTVAAGALLPAVLRRGTTAHRDMRSIAAELDRLYGASIAYTVRKKGENQCLGFVGSFLDERYVPGGERLLEPMADLLGELLLDPLTRNGRFLSDYVESEKENLIDAIESSHLGFACLDTVENEFGMYYYNRMGEPLNNPQLAILNSHPNVITTPHMAFYTKEAVSDMVENSILGLLDYFK